MTSDVCPVITRMLGRAPVGHTGFTLIELVVSLSISALLVAGLSAALTVGLRSAQPSQKVSGDIQAVKLADKILSDLALAKKINTALEHEIELTLPSRSGQPEDDTIRYQWNNDGSHELRRSFNGGPLELLKPSVTFFELDYDLRSQQLPIAPVAETPEYLLIEHDRSLGGTMNSYSTSLSRHCAQWFKPSLHPNAISWRLTRVQIVMRKPSDLTAPFRIRLHAANASSLAPEGTALSTLNEFANALPSDFDWVTFDLPDVAGLSPETGYCLTVSPTLFGFFPRVQFETASQPSSARGHWLTTSNSGSSWSNPNNSEDMRFRIFGTITIQAW